MKFLSLFFFLALASGPALSASKVTNKSASKDVFVSAGAKLTMADINKVFTPKAVQTIILSDSKTSKTPSKQQVASTPSLPPSPPPPPPPLQAPSRVCTRIASITIPYDPAQDGSIDEFYSSVQNLSGSNFDIERVLSDCSRLRRLMVWTTPQGREVQFDAWTFDKKMRLNEIYLRLARNDQDLGLSCPTPMSGMPVSQAGDTQGVNYRENQAFDIYAAHVAFSLLLEMGRTVGWSLFSFSQAELRYHLSSATDFSHILPSEMGSDNFFPDAGPGRGFVGSTIWNGGIVTWGMPCDPRVGFRFLTGEASTAGRRLIGRTPEETIANLSVWAMDHLHHGSTNGREFGSDRRTAPYYTLQDRLRPRPVNHFGWNLSMINLAAGCQSSSAILYELAKRINIPLLHIRTQDNAGVEGYYLSRTHAGLAFRWGTAQPRILWHTDDLYAEAIWPAFPIGQGGQPAIDDERRNLLFNFFWKTPEMLTSLGFQPEVTFPMVIPGMSWGENSGGPYNYLSDLGRFGGHWPLSRDTNYYRNVIAEATCAYENTRTFCRNYGPNIPSTLMTPTANCVRAIGGCARLESQVEATIRTWGINTILDTH